MRPKRNRGLATQNSLKVKQKKNQLLEEVSGILASEVESN